MFGIVLFIIVLVDAYTLCVLNSYYIVLRDFDLNVVGALSRYLFVLQHHLVRRSELFIFPHYLAMVKTSPGNC